jgi:phosphoglycolate phosphatase
LERLLVFDLDGTLVDSVRDLAVAANEAIGKVAPGSPAVPLDAVVSYVGEGARILVERCLRHAGLDLAPEAVLPVFFETYARHLLDTTTLYPGVAEALETLSGATLAVLTNKPGDFSRTILEGLGVAPRFARVWGYGDVPARKPDPSGLLRLIDELGATAAETWMIGDSTIDVRTARAAGVRACGVTWGLDPAGVRTACPDVLIDSADGFACLLAL